MNKENKKILRLLYQRGDFLSGEALGEALGVSRTAVWKRINRLKEEGYPIESVSNLGHRLAGPPRGEVYGIALEEQFEKAFGERDDALWKRLIFEETLDSSNLEAKRLILREPYAAEGTVVTCEMQTAGRGRRGRSWASPAGAGIWMSPILRPDIGPSKAPMMTLLAGMAVRDALDELYPIEPKIKWPNDIIVGNRKICGILTEMTTEDLDMTGVIIGIGINVSNEAFPAELKEVATSVTMETRDPEPDRAQIVCKVLSCLETYYRIFLQTQDLSGVKQAYDAHCVNIGRTVNVIGPKGAYQAKALGIGPMGELLLRLPDGTETAVSSGEVTIRGIMGYAE